MPVLDETPVQEFINHMLKVNSLEEVFAGYLIESKDEHFKQQQCEQRFRLMLENLRGGNSPEQLESGIREYISFITDLQQHQIKLFYQMLEQAVQQNMLSAKLVCESILNATSSQFTNEAFWCCSFSVVRRLIDKADYKEVRDLVKQMLEIVSNLPNNLQPAWMPQIESIKQIFTYVLDRNRSLFPAYLVADEIQKLYPKDLFPHWSVSRLLAQFVDSFRPTANICTLIGRSELLPVIYHQFMMSSSTWKLDSATGRAYTKGLLPFRRSVFEPQSQLVRSVLAQPYSRDCIVPLYMQSPKIKQHYGFMEECFTDLILAAMAKTSSALSTQQQQQQIAGNDQMAELQFHWLHLSSQLNYLVYTQTMRFALIANNLYTKLSNQKSTREADLFCVQTVCEKARDYLIWLLLSCVTAMAQQTPIDDFVFVVKIFDLLYPEGEVLDPPSLQSVTSPVQLAPICFWIYLQKKAEFEKHRLSRGIPGQLRAHLDFLNSNLSSIAPGIDSDSKFIVFLNTSYAISDKNLYRSPDKSWQIMMSTTIKCLFGSKTPNTGSTEASSVGTSHLKPIPVEALDWLTMQAKILLTHLMLGSGLNPLIKNKQASCILPAAFYETLSRLLAYPETEHLGLKHFICSTTASIINSHCWSLAHTTFEMLIYRLYHINLSHQFHLLNICQKLYSSIPHKSIALSLEHLHLHLLCSLDSRELIGFFTQIRHQPDPRGALIPQESEEMNKLFVLTLARAFNVVGCDTSDAASADLCKDLLSRLPQINAFSWSSSTMQCFPTVLREFYEQPSQQIDRREDKKQLHVTVKDQLSKWIAFTNEADLLNHFCQSNTSPVLLCIIWELLVDGGQSLIGQTKMDAEQQIASLSSSLLERLNVRQMPLLLRTFSNYLVSRFATSVDGQQCQKCIEALNAIIWRYQLVTLDRFVLFLILRAYENKEAQVCLFIIQQLMLKTDDFKDRIKIFVRDFQPNFWQQSNWSERLSEFHQKFPEKLYYEAGIFSSLPDSSGQQSKISPIYFSNICLRFLPILDLIIHRYLEHATNSSNSVEPLLNEIGPIYKFHHAPIGFLYNTLHYYEQKLKNKHQLKRRLVATVIGAFKDTRPRNWALSEAYLAYIQSNRDASEWNPDLEYYIKLVGRFVDTIASKSIFPTMNWRYNEFLNAGSHALFITCTELLALPRPSSAIANHLIDVVIIGHKLIPRDGILSWMNAIGQLFVHLPEVYLSTLNERVLQMLQSRMLLVPDTNCNIFDKLDFETQHNRYRETPISYMLALFHAVYFHSSIYQLVQLTIFLKEKVKPVIRTEAQFLFICHLIGPFLQSLTIERTRMVGEITIELYELLEIVDRNSEQLYHVDTICDLLYHIKYMFIGDAVKNDLERYIRNLSQPLQFRLRFITHMSFQNQSQQKHSTDQNQSVQKQQAGSSVTTTTVVNNNSLSSATQQQNLKSTSDQQLQQPMEQQKL